MTSNIQISPREMLVNLCHFGHKKSNWNPKIKKYIYGTKNGIHVFDLEESVKRFVELLNKISEYCSEGKTILFVSTKPQTQTLLQNIHETTGMPIVSYTWFGGLLTNFDTIKQRVALMKNLRDQFESGEIERYTKKEQSEFKKELVKLQRALGGLEKMSKLPDAVFVVDGKRDSIALKEAKRLGITVFGIIDSNADPDLYDFGVPGNDDSLKSLEYFLGHIEESIMNNKKDKKELAQKKAKDAPTGGVTKIKK